MENFKVNGIFYLFSNKEFGEVRTLTIDGEPWFVGRDVAKALEYVKPDSALTNHVDKEDKKTIPLSQGNGSNYKSKTTIINESGLYSLIFTSKTGKAKDFKRWVTAEVLPTLRKTGKYEMPIQNTNTNATTNTQSGTSCRQFINGWDVEVKRIQNANGESMKEATTHNFKKDGSIFDLFSALDSMCVRLNSFEDK